MHKVCVCVCHSIDLAMIVLSMGVHYLNEDTKKPGQLCKAIARFEFNTHAPLWEQLVKLSLTPTQDLVGESAPASREGILAP